MVTAVQFLPTITLRHASLQLWMQASMYLSALLTSSFRMVNERGDLLLVYQAGSIWAPSAQIGVGSFITFVQFIFFMSLKLEPSTGLDVISFLKWWISVYSFDLRLSFHLSHHTFQDVIFIVIVLSEDKAVQLATLSHTLVLLWS